jgi:hypothetical protein
MAAGRLIPVRVGDIELLVETVQVAGTEPTSSRAARALERAGDAFAQAQEVIVEVARSTADVIQRAAARSARPDRVEVEFGLAFSASGGVIMAGVSAEATLRVRLAYDGHPAAAAGPVPAGGDAAPATAP